MLKMLIFLSLMPNLCFADKHGHKQKAHEHGSVKIEMAVEGSQVDIELEGPAEAFLGFEYAPKTPKEIKTFNDARETWTKNLNSLLVLDSKLKCVTGSSSFEQVFEENEIEKDEQAKKKKHSRKSHGVHSEVKASAKIKCEQALGGSTLKIALKKHFKNIKKLSLDLVSRESKSVQITKSEQDVIL